MASRTSSTPNKNDLRWRRTDRLLLEALESELGEMPLDKVKVVSVCRTAQVSKAAFYAHYHDVYDLADALVDAVTQAVFDEIGDAIPEEIGPEEFMRRLIRALRSDQYRAFIKIADKNRMLPLHMERFRAEMERRVEEGTRCSLDDIGAVTTTYIACGAMAVASSHPEMSEDDLARILSDFAESTLASAKALRSERGWQRPRRGDGLRLALQSSQ